MIVTYLNYETDDRKRISSRPHGRVTTYARSRREIHLKRKIFYESAAEKIRSLKERKKMPTVV